MSPLGQSSCRLIAWCPLPTSSSSHHTELCVQLLRRQDIWGWDTDTCQVKGPGQSKGGRRVRLVQGRNLFLRSPGNLIWSHSSFFVLKALCSLLHCFKSHRKSGPAQGQQCHWFLPVTAQVGSALVCFRADISWSGPLCPFFFCCPPCLHGAGKGKEEEESLMRLFFFIAIVTTLISVLQRKMLTTKPKRALCPLEHCSPREIEFEPHASLKIS